MVWKMLLHVLLLFYSFPCSPNNLNSFLLFSYLIGPENLERAGPTLSSKIKDIICIQLLDHCWCFRILH